MGGFLTLGTSADQLLEKLSAWKNHHGSAGKHPSQTTPGLTKCSKPACATACACPADKAPTCSKTECKDKCACPPKSVKTADCGKTECKDKCACPPKCGKTECKDKTCACP